MIKIKKDFDKAVEVIKKGGVIVAPTDTLYGLLADALNKKAVERVYSLKKRSPDKPLIILIPSIDYLSIFGIKPSSVEEKLLERKGITVVMDIQDSKYEYLHRGKSSLAFRIPDYKPLIEFIRKVEKPLVAPSANPEGKPPPEDIKKAVEYFGDKVDLYVDKGKKKGLPSTIVKVNKDIKIIREGSIPGQEIKKML
ncbi:L-threonylcarbamoyladenylate synthase [Persephonella sp.]|uniref:L-threonylcarbamoyladenylate synthase n=1 Tax=Persephonella sp. TaxID=2060922 RepID=UPI00262CEA77|nr:L-threonylcarbamoyladenylate synthase [Persephonella sp.]